MSGIPRHVLIGLSALLPIPLVTLYAASPPPADVSRPSAQRGESDASPRPLVLKADDFRHYVDSFNENDNELYAQHIPNAAAWTSSRDNIPLLDCPDKELEEIYYFRWWTFRKAHQADARRLRHHRVPAAGRLGRQAQHDQLRRRPSPVRRPLAERSAVSRRLLDLLVPQGRQPPQLQFLGRRRDLGAHRSPATTVSPRTCCPTWSRTTRRGKATSRPQRPVLADRRPRRHGGLDQRAAPEAATAPRSTATCTATRWPSPRSPSASGRQDVAERVPRQGRRAQAVAQEKLWDPEAQFFKVLPRGEDTQLSDARELHGYTPWYFNLPDAGQVGRLEAAHGPARASTPPSARPPPSSATRSSRVSYQGHECQWNGPSWPYATAVTLTALANLLNNYEQDGRSRKEDYFDLLKIYAKSHHLKRDDGRVVPWIDENLNPAHRRLDLPDAAEDLEERHVGRRQRAARSAARTTTTRPSATS